jgi:hypothetical protein
MLAVAITESLPVVSRQRLAVDHHEPPGTAAQDGRDRHDEIDAVRETAARLSQRDTASRKSTATRRALP